MHATNFPLDPKDKCFKFVLYSKIDTAPEEVIYDKICSLKGFLCLWLVDCPGLCSPEKECCWF